MYSACPLRLEIAKRRVLKCFQQDKLLINPRAETLELCGSLNYVVLIIWSKWLTFYGLNVLFEMSMLLNVKQYKFALVMIIPVLHSLISSDKKWLLSKCTLHDLLEGHAWDQSHGSTRTLAMVNSLHPSPEVFIILIISLYIVIPTFERAVRQKNWRLGAYILKEIILSSHQY